MHIKIYKSYFVHAARCGESLAHSLPSFVRVACAYQDSCSEVRQQFAAEVNLGLKEFKLPIPYMSMLVLGCIDPEEGNAANVTDYLSALIDSWRVQTSTSKGDDLPIVRLGFPHASWPLP